MLRLQEVRDPVEGIIVDEDGAQKALLGLDIVRSTAVGRRRRVRGELEDVRISQGHKLKRAQDCGVIEVGSR